MNFANGCFFLLLLPFATFTLFIVKKQVPAALYSLQALKTRIKKLTAAPL